jgi:V/A-type H+-transporting ATPase subunit C
VSGDYGYANARIRALKSCLLNRQDYEGLIAAANGGALIQLLVRTAYKPDVEAALVRYQGIRCVTDALHRNVTRTVGSLRRFFDGRARELVEMLTARWDLFNLIAILRGQARGVAAEEILSVLVPAGILTETEFSELVQQPTIQATSELMLTWRLAFAGAVAEALRVSGGELASVESRLFQISFRDALARLGTETNDELVREMLESEIDVANLALLLRVASLRRQTSATAVTSSVIDTGALLISGGSLPLYLLAELAEAADVEALIGRLADVPYGQALRQRLEQYRQSGDVTVLERALEKLLALAGIRMFHRDPLTIAMAIGYLWAKTTETANIRMISQGKELGWPADMIRDEIFWWGKE